jgi:hypothetical protein
VLKLVFFTGPPGQVAAIAGKKAGMKQGELGGILKELGYTEDQVGFFVSFLPLIDFLFCSVPSSFAHPLLPVSPNLRSTYLPCYTSISLLGEWMDGWRIFTRKRVGCIISTTDD